MRVQDLMNRNVVTVTPDTTLKDVAHVLLERGVAGVPVCDAAGRVLGVVSESDILWKEIRPAPEVHGIVATLIDRAYGDRDRVEASTAGEAMSSPPVTVEPETSVAQAGRLMITHGVNRLPVVSDGKLVGIIARSDLVRAFGRPDDEIEREIREDVLHELLCVDPDSLWLMVAGGNVSIGGEVENRSTAESIEKYVARVPGVAGVRSELRWDIDDRSHRIHAAADRLPRRI
jgi:CBS domain-containing protein